jgi:hypothetical protein
LSARVASLKYAAHRYFVQTRGSYRLQNEGDIHISFAKAGCVKSSMTPGSPATRTYSRQCGLLQPPPLLS